MHPVVKMADQIADHDLGQSLATGRRRFLDRLDTCLLHDALPPADAVGPA
jgi:hypothetical protein